MRIKNVKIHNYRSFKDVDIDLDQYTVIVGPNNIGKSNILRAIKLFFSPRARRRRIRSRRFLYRGTRNTASEYNFERDFPVNIQHHQGKKVTRITLTFMIEHKDFSTYALNDKLKRHKTITVVKDMNVGRDKQDDSYTCFNLSQTDRRIFLDWLFRTCEFITIPSSRAAESSENLLSSFTRRVWSSLERSSKVKGYLRDLRKRAKQEIESVEKQILNKLSLFIPGLNKIELELNNLTDITDILNIEDIRINDGTRTSLASKGDGVQSLFFIGLLQHMSSLKTYKNLIFGIEEPELHLHPNAQDELVKVLKSISIQRQVILTTHSPVLINLSKIPSNIIVKKDTERNKLKIINPTSLLPIREVLGVKPSHNLRNAEIVLLVEGPTEEKIVTHVLIKKRERLRSMIGEGRLRIVHNKGASGIVNTAVHYKRELQLCLALFDDDEEGNSFYNKCLNENVMEPEDVFKIPSRNSFKDSELEDLFQAEYTIESLKCLNINISKKDFLRHQRHTGNNKTKPRKWTLVVENILNQTGKGTSLETVNKIKTRFANIVIEKIKLKEIPKLFDTIINRIDRVNS